MDTLEEVKERKSEGRRIAKQYSYDVKLRAVKLYLEEGLPGSLLSKELGVKSSTLFGWLRAYRASGEAGLRGRGSKPGRRRKLPAPVRAKVKPYTLWQAMSNTPFQKGHLPLRLRIP